jgi:ABC-type transport system involved in multi-copper enzyme maturation permease subunit
MFRAVAAFELRYQLRSPAFWASSLVFLALSFGAVVSDNIQIGGGGNVLVNSPYAIAQAQLVMSVFAIFLMTAFVANVVVRDDETRFGPLIQATRLRTFDYLFGRFTGAFAAGCLAFLAVPLGMMAGAAMPWLDPQTVGPFRPDHYLWVYALLCVPTLFATGAGFFALATATRSMMWTYVGVVGFLVLYVVAMGLASRPEFEDYVALFEPFGLGAFGQATRYWSAVERNTQLPAFTGHILWNRALWVAIACALLAAAWALHARSRRARGSAPGGASAGGATALPGVAAPPTPVSGVAAAAPATLRGSARAGAAPRAAGWAQLTALTRFDVAASLRHPAFFVLLAIGVFNASGSLWFADELYGNTIHPVTRVMIGALEGAFAIIPLVIAIFFGGELVWRDRDRRMHEIVDATPAPDWAFLVPKLVALTLVLFATLLASTLAAVAVQALKGYTQFEFGRYLLWYVLPLTVTVTHYAVLAVFMHVLAPNKAVGWMLMLGYLVSRIALGPLGLDHGLYRYGSAPDVPLSDMNGRGDFAAHAAWFDAYWSAAALLLAVFAYALWQRGTIASLGLRLRRAPGRLAGAPGVIAGFAVVAMAALGGWIFYNTNVLNRYESRDAVERRQADYEKALIGYETLPQPRITDVTLDVEIHPREPRLVTRGAYRVENRTGAPLAVVHVRWAPELDMKSLVVDGARLEKDYGDFNYRIYRYDRPLAPGARHGIRFESVRAQRGFRNSGNESRVVDNGTFVDNMEIAPMLGMSRDGLLVDRAKRRKYGLPPERRMPTLEDGSARMYNMLRRDSDWVNSDITVSTEADQLAIAPGYREYETVANGRRTARYRSESPIQNFFSIQSARYAVHRDRWRDVELSIYHHPGHDWNLERMAKAMKASLDYYTTNFSPYQFRQVRILEFPAYATFAQSFANTIPYSEGIGFIANYADPDKIDMVTYVTAHEIAHQWWAHQVMAPQQQGATLIIESLAQYSALMVMERMYGPEQIRRFLKYELDGYLRSRGSELLEELPLERVENQGYIHYQKGGLAMYLLKDQIGEEAVNAALRDLIAAYAFKPAPYPDSRELVGRLRAAAGPGRDGLLTDLFSKITLYDVKVTRAGSARRADGRWDVTLDVEARKLYADGQGVETEAPLAESFEVGVFTVEPGEKGYDRSSVIALQRLPLRSGRQTVTISVDREPRVAGVDPFNKWIDRNSDDNLRKVEAAGAAGAAGAVGAGGAGAQGASS